jgi:hypothetical protein
VVNFVMQDDFEGLRVSPYGPQPETDEPAAGEFLRRHRPCSDSEFPTAPDAALRLANCNALGKPANYQSVTHTATIGRLSGGINADNGIPQTPDVLSGNFDVYGARTTLNNVTVHRRSSTSSATVTVRVSRSDAPTTSASLTISAGIAASVSCATAARRCRLSPAVDLV